MRRTRGEEDRWSRMDGGERATGETMRRGGWEGGSGKGGVSRLAGREDGDE